MNEFTLGSTEMLSDTLLQSVNQDNYLKEVRAETFSILHIRLKFFQHWKSLIMTQKQENEYISKICQNISGKLLNSYFLKWKKQIDAFKQLAYLKEKLKAEKYIKLWYQKYLDRYQNERKEIEIQLMRRKLAMRTYFNRWKYVKSLEKQSRRYTRDANQIFLRRAFMGWFNIIDKRKKLVRNYETISSNHLYFTVVGFWDFWKDSTRRQRKYRICQKRVNSIIQGVYFYLWNETYYENIRLSKLLSKYQKTRIETVTETVFYRWFNKYNNRIRITTELSNFIQNSRLNLMKKYFDIMCDIHESKVNDEKMVIDVSNQLQLSKLRQIFYRWADDAESLKKIHDKIRNVRKMMVNSSLNRYFSKWFSNYSISKFNREKTQEYIEKSTNTLLKRSFTRWSALFKSRVATKDMRNKISWFIKKNFYKKGLKGFKQNKDEHDMIRKAAIFRRTKLLLTIYNPWKKSFLKFKKLEFLIKSVIDFGRIVSMKKGILAFKRYHLYLLKKEEEENEAMKIYEDRKVEIFVRGFIEGSQGVFVTHSESEDLLKSDISEESIDEIPQKVDVVQEMEPIVEEIPKPVITYDSKPKPLPNSAPKFEIPEIMAPRRPSFLPAPNKPILSNKSSPSNVIPSSPPCSPERLKIDNVITHQKSIPIEENMTNNFIEPVEPEKPKELIQNDQKSEKEVDPLTVELPPPKPLPQGIEPVNAAPQPMPMIPPHYEKSMKRTRQEVIELVIAFSKRLNEIQRQPITPELKSEASQIMNEIIQLKSELSVCL